MLAVNHIFFNYGKVRTLEDINLEIKDGRSICVIGANGAGKTTLAKVISGILKPLSGDIVMNGKEITGKPAHSIVKEGISLVPEGRDLFVRQSVRVNLELGAYHLRGICKKEQNNQVEKIFKIFPILKERQNQIAGSLSGGEQQMLAIGRALMAKPRLLILDEPSKGLSPILVEEIASTITQLISQGTSIILIEQNAHLALDITDMGYVIESGRITLSGPSSELTNNQMVQEAYLGISGGKGKSSGTSQSIPRREVPNWICTKKYP